MGLASPDTPGRATTRRSPTMGMQVGCWPGIRRAKSVLKCVTPNFFVLHAAFAPNPTYPEEESSIL